MLSSYLVLLLMGRTASEPLAWDATADWKTPVVSLRHLAREMSMRTGRMVEVSREVPDLAVYVNAKNKSAAEILNLVAHATTTSWYSERGKIMIRRSRGDTEAEKGRFESELTSQTQEGMSFWPTDEGARDLLVEAIGSASMAFQRDPSRKLGETSEKIGEVYELFPASRVARIFALEYGVESLATRSSDRLQVFASHPTHFQRSLPGRKGVLMAAARKALDETRAVFAQVPAELRSQLQSIERIRDMARHDGSLARMIITIRPRDERHDLSISVKMFDEKGEWLDWASLELPGASRTEPLWSEPLKHLDRARMNKHSAEVVEAEAQWADLHSSHVDESNRDEVLERMKAGNFYQNRPSVLSSILDADAKVRGDIVIEVPLGAYVTESRGTDYWSPTERVLNGELLEFTEIDKTRVGRLRADSWRYNRAYPEAMVALAANRIVSNGALGLEDYADIATRSRNKEELGIGLWIAKVLSGLRSQHRFDNRIDILRVYGELSRGERSLVRGDGIHCEISQAPRPLRDWVKKVLSEGAFFPGSGFDLETGQSKHYTIGPGSRFTSPYEALPSVISARVDAHPVKVTFVRHLRDRLLARDDQGNVSAFTPARAGAIQATGVALKPRGILVGGTPMKEFAMGREGILEVRVQQGSLPPSSEFYFYIDTKSPRFGPLEALPNRVRKEFIEAYETELKRL